MTEPGVFHHLTQRFDLLCACMQFGSGKTALLRDVDVFDGAGPFSDLWPDTQPLIDLLAAVGQGRGAGIVTGLECVAGGEWLDQGKAPAACACALLQGQCQAGTDQTAANDGDINGFHGVLLLA